MPTTITATKAEAGGTFIVTCAFTDEDDSPVAPDTLTWSLYNSDGEIINSREDVAIESPSTSEDIVLYGDDLVVGVGHDEDECHLIINGTYTSSAGAGLPLRNQLNFYVVDLKD